MSCTFCGQSPCGCQPLPPACNCPPSPQPPWSRPVQSPRNQMLSDTAVPLVLDPNIAYLNQTQTSGAPITNNMAMPNGNFLRQRITIMVLGNILAATATWIFSGNFVNGFTQLTFNSLGYNAELEWDGNFWQLMSGNAQLS